MTGLQRTLIDGACCVLPGETRLARILIEGSQIIDIDPPPTARVDVTVSAPGLHLLPGLIDDQVHFREPGLEHKEDLRTGSIACAKGGITTFLEMPNTKPTTTTLEALDSKLALAASKCVVNFGFYIGATLDNLPVLQAARRTPGIKIFIGSSTGNLLVDDQEVLERIFAETTLPICAHCEDETTVRANQQRFAGISDVAVHSQVRDHQAALVATRRAIDLATRHRHQFHVLHVSTAEEVAFLKDRPDWVTAEACPHHLFFHTEDYARLGSRIQMNPSIKTAADCAALWSGLQAGVIEVVATDHAPHTLEEKAQPYPQSPSGLPAVENSLALMLDATHRGLCTIEQVVEWMSTAPARIWKLACKGQLAPGYDADLVLVDLDLTQEIRDEQQVTKCRWSPWHGTALRGWPVRTWVLGQTVWEGGQLQPGVLGQEVTFNR